MGFLSRSPPVAILRHLYVDDKDQCTSRSIFWADPRFIDRSVPSSLNLLKSEGLLILFVAMDFFISLLNCIFLVLYSLSDLFCLNFFSSFCRSISFHKFRSEPMVVLFLSDDWTNPSLPILILVTKNIRSLMAAIFHRLYKDFFNPRNDLGNLRSFSSATSDAATPSSPLCVLVVVDSGVPTTARICLIFHLRRNAFAANFWQLSSYAEPSTTLGGPFNV